MQVYGQENHSPYSTSEVFMTMNLPPEFISVITNTFGEDSEQLVLKWIDILHEHLGLERERIHEWSLAHAILSAWWGIEDNTGWEYAMQYAEMIAQLK